MYKVEFRHGVGEGTILRIRCAMLRKGRTSVTYRVDAADARSSPERPVFQTNVTFVSVDDSGAKREI